MIGKLLLFALCGSVAFSQESNIDSVDADLQTLKHLTEDGQKRVRVSSLVIENAPEDFRNLTQERVQCLVWEHTAQRIATNKSVAEAIKIGMEKNKQFNSFQCVSKAAQELFEKFDAMEPHVPLMSAKIREKALAPVKALGLILPGFSDYCMVTFKEKRTELLNAKDQAARNKIVKGVSDKMKNLQGLLQQVDDFVKTSRFKFLEEHINFAFQVENNLKKVQREGVQKILKCVN